MLRGGPGQIEGSFWVRIRYKYELNLEHLEKSMNEEKGCLECGVSLAEGEGVETEQGFFCNHCYDSLVETVKLLAENQTKGINYPLSLLGGLVGAAVGGVVWWAVTLYSGYNLGIVAIIIGVAAAKGITFCNGGKRSLALQILAVVLTAISFFYAIYLVTRSFILMESPQEYVEVFTLLPHPQVFLTLIMETSDIMTFVFLGIALWTAWSMMKPHKL